MLPACRLVCLSKASALCFNLNQDLYSFIFSPNSFFSSSLFFLPVLSKNVVCLHVAFSSCFSVLPCHSPTLLAFVIHFLFLLLSASQSNLPLEAFLVCFLLLLLSLANMFLSLPSLLFPFLLPSYLFLLLLMFFSLQSSFSYFILL